MAESALAARTKIRPPCTLKHRVQQEYNSLLVNALNRNFKSNMSLNNFKWLPTKLGFRAFEILNPVLGNASEMDTPTSRPRWSAHTRQVMYGSNAPLPPPGVEIRCSLLIIEFSSRISSVLSKTCSKKKLDS